MPTLTGLDPTLQVIGTGFFVLLVAAFAAWSLVFGKKPEKTQTQEFAMAGQLADMGPVKELVAQTGLLVQQMIRANMAQEQTAEALRRLAIAYEGQINAERTEHEVEAEVQRRFEREMDRERRARRRVTKRAAPARATGQKSQ